MEWYLQKLARLIKTHGKAKIAVELDVKDTRTIDAWIGRQMIPSKYLDTIKELR